MQPSLFAILWHLLHEFHGRVYKLTAYIVLYELLKLVPAGVLAIVIDSVISFDPAQIPFLLILIGVLFIASMLVSFLDAHIAYEASMIDFECQQSLLKQVAAKLLQLPIGYHEKYNTGQTVHTLHRGVANVGELIFFTGKDAIPTITQLLLTTAILLWIGIVPTLAFVVFLPVFFVLIHVYGKRVQPIRQQYHEQMTMAAGYIGERIMNVRTVQDFAVESREISRYADILKDFVSLGRQRMGHYWSHLISRDIVMNIARASLMGLGVFLVARGELTPGMLVLFITLTEKANIALFRFAFIYDRAGDSIEGIRAMVRLFTEEELITQKSNAVSANDVMGHIQFQNVTFAYDKGKEVLKTVSFEVKRKTMLAVIGRSGAGKSTIVKLMYRHYDVTDGSIKIDGTDIRDYKIKEFRRQIALVPQDIEIFNATVRENIAFGSFEMPRDVTLRRPEPTRGLSRSAKSGAPLDDNIENAIIRAATIAYAHDFIEQFPQGYDTLVGERGVKLSGGQRQRIGIARALLANPSILIFDEATSSLDTESEQLIQKAMREIAKNYTMIVIAHRLSTIEHADTVMVMEHGKVAEIGTHEDLIKHGGVYLKMRELQRLGEVRG